MTEPRDPAHDFDFLLGRWNVRHRRLRHRLLGDRQWDSFTGTMIARRILAGRGNFDENAIALPAGAYRACTLRICDVETGRWSIHWIDGRDPKLDPPVTGSFEDGVGTFYGDDLVGGRPVRVRFLWTGMTTARPRWEQAFSGDGGRTWETNWIMDFAGASA